MDDPSKNNLTSLVNLPPKANSETISEVISDTTSDLANTPDWLIEEVFGEADSPDYVPVMQLGNTSITIFDSQDQSEFYRELAEQEVSLPTPDLQDDVYPLSEAEANGEIKMVRAAIGIIENEFGQVFVSRRRAGLDYENSLEFPGGKIEADESPEVALVRELHEEIGIDAITLHKILKTNYSSGNKIHELHFYWVSSYIGVPEGLEGQDTY